MAMKTIGRLSLLAIALGGLWSGLCRSAYGEAQPRPAGVIDRETALSGQFVWRIPALAHLLPEAIVEDAKNLLAKPANLVAWRPVPRDVRWTPGGFRWRAGYAANIPVFVVEDDLVPVAPPPAEAKALSEPAFRNAMSFLRAYHALALRYQSVLGPLHQGIAALAAYERHYATNRAWSLVAKEELAAYYLLVAANDGSPLGIAPTVEQVRALLARLYQGWPDEPGRLDAAAHRLMDPPPQVIERLKPKEAVLDVKAPEEFCVAQLLAPGIIGAVHQEAPLPEYMRQAAARIAEFIHSRPGAFPHLPSRYRLLRNCRVITGGMQPALVARQAEGLPAAKPSESQERLDALRAEALKWFADEAKIRGGGHAAMPTAHTVAWDPHAMAELVALLIDHSAEYAKRVRVPAAENPDVGTDQLKEMVEAAFRADSALSQLFADYGKPEVEVDLCPSAPTGKALALHWKMRAEGRVVDHVWLLMEDGFSRGGSGLPVEPGLAADHKLAICRPSLACPPRELPLSAVLKGDLVQAVADLGPGEADPPKRTRWYPIVSVKVFSMTGSIHVNLGEAGTLVGTASQEVWARRIRRAKSAWEWVAMGDLRPGDGVWHVQRGCCPVKGWRRGPPAPRYVQLATGETDHSVVEGFLARWQSKELPDLSHDGLLASTLLLLEDENGNEKTQEIATISADLKASRFVRCPGFSSATARVRRRKDLLLDRPEDRAQVLHWVAYDLDGTRTTIGVARSHGLLVKREGRLETVFAHNIAEGDELVRGEGDRALAKVLAVGIQECEGGPWPLNHPRLLRCEWVQGNGILVHAKQKRADFPGVIASTKIALAIPPSGEEKGWRVGKQVPVEGLSVCDRTRLNDPSCSFHLLLTCWPGGRANISQSPEFMPQAIGGLQWGVTADLMRVTTEQSRVVCCSPATQFWRQCGEEVQGRTKIETVGVGELRRGDRILALAGTSGPAATTFDRVVSLDLIDAFEVQPKKGYFDLYYVELLAPQVKAMAEFIRNYKNIFANGLLISHAAEPDPNLDLWRAFRGDGSAPGRTPSPRAGHIIGESSLQANPANSPFPQPFINVPTENAPPPLSFDAGDLDAFRRSMTDLEDAMRKFRGREPRSLADPARFARFAAACLPPNAQRPEDVFAGGLLDAAFVSYCNYRGLLIRSGHPEALESSARAGVPFSYCLFEVGGLDAARALLSDLLTLQMRLALRPRSGRELWSRSDLLIRDSVRYAVEFEKLGNPAPPPGDRPSMDQAAAQRFWDVAWPCRWWSDLLLHRIQDKEIHEDVLPKGNEGEQQVLLWNLVLQMDRRSGQCRVLTGFLSPNFAPEFTGEIREKFGPQQSAAASDRERKP